MERLIKDQNSESLNVLKTAVFELLEFPKLISLHVKSEWLKHSVISTQSTHKPKFSNLDIDFNKESRLT